MVTREACQMKGDGYCPRVLENINFFKNKWTFSVLVTVGNFKNIRFNQLLNRIGGISAKVLSDRLSKLESNGLVFKKVLSESPPHVEYKLTVMGMELYKSLKPLIEWSYREVLE